jgi:hypothetical protein
MGLAGYFRVNPRSICLDGWAAGGQTSCYGVNLAFAGLGGWVLISGFGFPEGWGSRAKMGRAGYFRVNRRSICMDGWVAGRQTSCYGVNLAFAGLGGWVLISGFGFPESWESRTKTGRAGYFRVNRGPICMDGWAAVGQASCCGVNLAFAGLGVGCFSGVWLSRELGEPDQNGTSGVLSCKSRADLYGRLGGRGSGFLLWGEPGLRWIGGFGVGGWGLISGVLV